MVRTKIIFLLVMVFAILLSSCAPGAEIPQQVATYVSDALTQTMMPPATSTPLLGEATLHVGSEATVTPIPSVMGSFAQVLYQSPTLGIQFSYPSTWYRNETNSRVTLTSFDPSNPPHKLEWTDQTVSMQFGYKVLITPPASFDAWVESAKQTALANGLSIFAEERFVIAHQPAAHLTLVSGSGGIIHQVLTDLSGRYFEINIEGNYNLAKAVLDSIQPFAEGAIRPPNATAPPPIVEYKNSTVGYKLNLPGNWIIDENGMTNGISKEVTFSPPNLDPFIAYMSISLDSRTLDQIINLYAQSVPDAVREDTNFNGYPGIKYTYTYQNNVYRIDYYIPYGGRIFLITTDRPNDGTIQSILMTVRFTAAPQPITYEASMADNGRTFYMNIGDKLRVNLDLSYIWSMASISNPAVLAGAGDGYFAFTSGTATLTTTGNPECLNLTPPCGMPSIMFTITVVVQ